MDKPLCAAAKATTSNTLKVIDGDMFDNGKLMLWSVLVVEKQNDCHYVEAKRATKVISVPSVWMP